MPPRFARRPESNVFRCRVEEPDLWIPGTQTVHGDDAGIERAIRSQEKGQTDEAFHQGRHERRGVDRQTVLNLVERPPVATEVEELANQRIGFRGMSRGVVDQAQGPVTPMRNEMRRTAEPGRRAPHSTRSTHGKGITIVGRHSDVKVACACFRLSRAFCIAGLGAFAELNLAMCALICVFRGLKSTCLSLSNPVSGFEATAARRTGFLAFFLVAFLARGAAGRAALRFLATSTP